jgi:hypothetical protein
MDWLPDIETGALAPALVMMQLGEGGAMTATAAGG